MCSITISVLFHLNVSPHRPWLLGRHHSSESKDVWASIAEAEGSKHSYGALDDYQSNGKKLLTPRVVRILLLSSHVNV